VENSSPPRRHYDFFKPQALATASR
jgi:hypothetical protein